MSKFIATITHINSVENLNIVKFNFNDTILTMMSLDLNKDMKVDTKVYLSVKPTHIAIGKDFSGEVSYANQLKAKIKDITNGKLLSSIKLDINNTIIESIITVESSLKMDLKIGDSVTALIKSNELSIYGVVL